MIGRCVGYVTSFRENATPRQWRGTNAIRVLQTMGSASRKGTVSGPEWESQYGIWVR